MNASPAAITGCRDGWGSIFVRSKKYPCSYHGPRSPRGIPSSIIRAGLQRFAPSSPRSRRRRIDFRGRAPIASSAAKKEGSSAGGRTPFIRFLNFANSKWLPPFLVDARCRRLRARRMAYLAKRLRFVLTNPFTGDEEVLADLFERVVGFLADPETHAKDLLFARREGRENLPRLLREVDVHHGFGRIDD